MTTDSVRRRPTAGLPFNQVREDIYARLRARRAEILDALLLRVYTVSEPPASVGPEYAEGLKEAVAETLDFNLAASNLQEDEPREVPSALLAQTRRAARSRVSLDTVLRRCIAGQALLTDFMVEEAASSGLDADSMRRLLTARAALVDHLVLVVGAEYSWESLRRRSTAEQREEQVKRLLDGKPVDVSQIPYDFEANHLGAVVKGPSASSAVRRIAAAFEDHLQVTDRRDHTVWAWFGSRAPIDPDALLERSRSEPQIEIALGEPSCALSGWRLTHRQARAALSIGLRTGKSPVRYADVALLISISGDELLCSSLRTLYLAPLQRSRDGGRVAHETLRAYFAAKRNVSSAAAILGVNRRTVANRLHAIEDQLGRSLDRDSAEIESALRLHDLEEAGVSRN
jgi:DNA-binding PucR family transcriptional regulator